jgi:hypothetical protein
VLTLYFVQESYDGQTWHEVLEYPGGRNAAPIFSLESAQDLISGLAMEIKMGRRLFGGKKFRIISCALPMTIIEKREL